MKSAYDELKMLVSADVIRQKNGGQKNCLIAVARVSALDSLMNEFVADRIDLIYTRATCLRHRAAFRVIRVFSWLRTCGPRKDLCRL